MSLQRSGLFSADRTPSAETCRIVPGGVCRTDGPASKCVNGAQFSQQQQSDRKSRKTLKVSGRVAERKSKKLARKLSVLGRESHK